MQNNPYIIHNVAQALRPSQSQDGSGPTSGSSSHTGMYSLRAQICLPVSNTS